MPVGSSTISRALGRGVEQLEARTAMSAGQGGGNGPPEWAVARGHLDDDAVVAPPSGEDVGGDDDPAEHAPPKDAGGVGSGRGDEGAGAKPEAGDGPAADSPDADPTTVPDPAGAGGEPPPEPESATRDEVFRFLPVSSVAAGLAAPLAPETAPGATLAFAPTPGDTVGSTPPLAAGRGAMLGGEHGSASESPAGGGGAAPAAAGGDGRVPAGDEFPTEAPVGPTASESDGLAAAAGAGILNHLCPPPVLAELTQAVGQLAVLVEDDAGGGWEAWAVAAGLAAAAGEFARRQLRRRAARPAPLWEMGGPYVV